MMSSAIRLICGVLATVGDAAAQIGALRGERRSRAAA